MPDHCGQYIAVLDINDLRDGHTRRVLVNGHPVLVANVADRYYAVDDMCTHEDSSLSLGCLKGEFVHCTLHGSRFSVVTGDPMEEPATESLRTYPVRIEADRLLVGVEPNG